MGDLIDSRIYDDIFLLSKILGHVELSKEEKKKVYKHFEKQKNMACKLVDADALIDKAWYAENGFGWEKVVSVNDINIAPTIDPVKWTPCGEGPPKEESEVLVTTSWNDVCKAWYSNGKWRAEFTNEYDDDEILAWMPLPKPYRKDDN